MEHDRSRLALVALLLSALGNSAAAQLAHEQEIRIFKGTHDGVSSKDYPSSTSCPDYTPLELHHRIGASGVADFTGPSQRAMVESQVASSFTVRDRDHTCSGAPITELTETFCEVSGRSFGDAGANPTCGAIVIFSLMGDVVRTIEHTSPTSFIGSTGGELVESLPSRGLGSLDFVVGPTVLRLHFTAQQIEAGADLTYEGSVMPSARLYGRLRAKPGRVRVTGHFVTWAPGAGYLKKIHARLFLGELLAHPNLVSTSTNFTAHVPWEHTAVLLKLVLLVQETIYHYGPIGLNWSESQWFVQNVSVPREDAWHPGSGWIGW